MEKKISVIIPCYNVENYIDQCVQSLVSQTIGLEYLELIFVDDASTDATVEKLLQWEEKYQESILVIVCEENGKQGTARNIGMQYASGEYIGFVDSDDWIESQMYAALFSKAEEYQCDIVSCLAYRNKVNGREIPEKAAGEDYLCENKNSAVIDGEWPAMFSEGGLWKKLYRKDMLVQHQILFPEKLLYEDNFFGAIVSMHCKRGYHIDKHYYHYRENSMSTTQQRNQFWHFDRLEIEILKLHKFQEMGVFERFYQEIETQFFEMYYFNTLFIMATRFDVPPFSVFQRMKREILQWFPDYKDTLHIEDLGNPLFEVLLRLLSLDLNEEQFLRIMRKYTELPR